MKERRIGILGGTFDPIHMGHLLMAEQAAEQFSLDGVWFMPSKNPPHKNNKGILEDAVRKEMVELAIEGNARFSCSDVELAKDGVVYTVDTLREITAAEPSNEYFFIMGADSFFQFETWKEPEEITKMATILAVPRDGVGMGDMERRREYLTKLYGEGTAFLIEMPQMGVSSTEIRERRKQGKNVRYFVPEPVYRYMEENDLYDTRVPRSCVSCLHENT